MRKIVIVAMLSACATGAPPHFSGGNTWTFPLVDPLADGKLVTPVFIEGKGPYLFAIDPDAPLTVADSELIVGNDFRAHPGVRAIDEHDTTHPTFYLQLTSLRVGDLTVHLDTVRVSSTHAFDTERRRIFGVLGRDVIADSLVFGFDRERGIAWLKTQEAFQPSEGAQVIDYYTRTRQRMGLVPRRLVAANIDGTTYDLHLDLGDVTSQLRPEHWNQAKLRSIPWNMTLVDEVGTHRHVSSDGMADRVSVGPVTRDQIGFVPYDDRRWDYVQLDGTLGLDFFRPYSVAADWHHQRYYLTPRLDSAAQTQLRLARWGEMLPPCAASGCVAITASSDAVDATRDPRAVGANLEVVLRATSATGQQLPTLFVSLPAGVDHVTATIDRRYAGATYAVLDVSPFAYDCNGCIAMAAPPAP